MAVVSYYPGDGLTAEVFEEGARQQKEMGQFPPTGQIFRVTYGDPDNLQMLSCWENREAFDRYFEDVIKPIMEKNGTRSDRVVVSEVHDLAHAGKLAEH